MCRPARHQTSGGVLAPVLLAGVVLAGIAAAPTVLAALSALISGLLICAGITAGLTGLLIAGLLIRDRRAARTSRVHTGHTPPAEDSWQVYQEQTVYIQHTVVTVVHRGAQAVPPAHPEHPVASNGHPTAGRQARPALPASIGWPTNSSTPAGHRVPVDNRRPHTTRAGSRPDQGSS